MENLEVKLQGVRKQYKSPELNDFGKVGEVTRTTGDSGPEDGVGTGQYTS